MKKGFLIISGLAILILLNSCAASYKSINPKSLNYGLSEEQDGISFTYKTNVLQASNNKKLVRKEDNSDISVIAVKITNNSPETITFTEDVYLSSGLSAYNLLTPTEITSVIKQNAASYLLFLLLTPVKLYIGNESGDVDEYSIGYALGPGIALGNMAVASTANGSFKNELTEYSLINKEIKSGETVYGLVGIRNFGFGNLHLKRVSK